MSVAFWSSTIVMAVLAYSFLAAPLKRSFGRRGSLGIAIAMPLFAAVMYGFVGSPRAASSIPPLHSPEERPRVVDEATQGSVGSVASLVDGLASRLEENPDDAGGWLLLARSYEHLGRIPEAQDAYKKAADLGEYDEGLASLGTTPRISVQGSLHLSERARAIVQANDTVFVFARAEGGPPMPVAVARYKAADLPLEFSLTDRNAMSPDVRLSDFERLTVAARISRSGSASDALKELEARSDTVTIGDDRRVTITIE